MVAFRQTGANQDVSIQLNPIELGRVSIKIDRNADGPASVSISAERPETLALLQRDQAQLRDALDQAGLPQTAHTLSFHLAPPVQPAAASSGSQTGNQPGSQNSGQPYDPRGQQASSGGADQSGGGRGGPFWQRAEADPDAPEPSLSSPIPAASRAPRARAWSTQGLSITA